MSEASAHDLAKIVRLMAEQPDVPWTLTELARRLQHDQTAVMVLLAQLVGQRVVAELPRTTMWDWPRKRRFQLIDPAGLDTMAVGHQSAHDHDPVAQCDVHEGRVAAS